MIKKMASIVGIILSALLILNAGSKSINVQNKNNRLQTTVAIASTVIANQTSIDPDSEK